MEFISRRFQALVHGASEYFAWSALNTAEPRAHHGDKATNLEYIAVLGTLSNVLLMAKALNLSTVNP